MSAVIVGGREVLVRELTVGEIRRWLLDLDQRGEPDVVGAMLFEDADLDTIERMTNLRQEDMQGLKPSELRELVRACQEVNSHFFSMARRMGAILAAGENSAKSARESSSAPAPDSPG